MDDNKTTISYEEVLDTEINDIWDIFFPYMAEKKEALQKLDVGEEKKPGRHLRFIAM